jgi:hypothetical protein
MALDPATGFHNDERTGLPKGIAAIPHPQAPVEVQFPKWVTPHIGHVVRSQTADAPPAIVTPAFPHFHVGRDGAVTVLVHDADEEAHALRDPATPAPPKPMSLASRFDRIRQQLEAFQGNDDALPAELHVLITDLEEMLDPISHI